MSKLIEARDNNDITTLFEHDEGNPTLHTLNRRIFHLFGMQMGVIKRLQG